MTKGVLIDVTKCIGCGSCVVACKLWNDRRFDDENPGQSDNPSLTDHNWTTVKNNVVNKEGKEVLRFAKKQCLHCIDPACSAACFSKSFRTVDGAVLYNPKLCVGCRYCMLACPFDIPKYEWEKVLPSVTKCQMCYSKTENGESLACSGVCPTDAIVFGEREELLVRAKGLIKANPSYVDHIYGENEAGGTSWLYISDVPFDQLGFKTNVTTRALPKYVSDFTQWVPHMFIGGGAILASLSFYTKRRHEVSKVSLKDKKEGSNKNE